MLSSLFYLTSSVTHHYIIIHLQNFVSLLKQKDERKTNEEIQKCSEDESTCESYCTKWESCWESLEEWKQISENSISQTVVWLNMMKKGYAYETLYCIFYCIVNLTNFIHFCLSSFNIWLALYKILDKMNFHYSDNS